MKNRARYLGWKGGKESHVLVTTKTGPPSSEGGNNEIRLVRCTKRKRDTTQISLAQHHRTSVIGRGATAPPYEKEKVKKTRRLRDGPREDAIRSQTLSSGRTSGEQLKIGITLRQALAEKESSCMKVAVSGTIPYCKHQGDW